MSIAALAPLAQSALVQVAHAQPAPDAAESNVDPHLAAGRKLLAEGKTKEACDELTAGKEAGGSMELRFELAACDEALGKTASAYAELFDVATSGAAAGPELAEKAARRAAELEGKLSKILITAPAGAKAKVTVADNGAPVPPSLWGRAFPVDPGVHVITAEEPGKPKWSSRVDIGSTPGVVEVKVPFTAALSVPQSPAVEPVSPLTPGRYAAVAAAGAGLVGLSAGVVFGVRALLLEDEAEGKTGGTPHCDAQDVCDARGVTLRSDAKSAGLFSTIVVIAGGAAMAGGVALWVLSPPKSAPNAGAPSASVSMGPQPRATAPPIAIGTSGTGLWVGGAF